MPQEPHIVASWSEDGHVYLWDINQHVKALDTPPTGQLSKKPLKILEGHSTEGFGLGWSKAAPGRLITGDRNGISFLTEMTPDGSFVKQNSPYAGHKSSVEDVDWSPTEKDVFATCSVDKTVQKWKR